MEILKKEGKKLKFKAEVSEELANAIRRSALEIPILAIEEVEFHKNDSALYDEVLALRLGLLPLKTTKSMKKGKEVKGKLKAEGPGIVYASEIKGSIEPIYPKMPIVKLTEGQEIEMNLIAKTGKGTEHTKYSPGLVYYSRVPEVEEINKSDIEDQEVVEVDEDSLEEIKGGETKKKYDYLGEVVKNEDNYLYVKSGDEIIFNIESWGQISKEKIVEESAEASKENLEEVKKAK